jgi:CDP-diacylglycerol--glycerol-3-phosphate 3-phosphatidyltransferase
LSEAGPGISGNGAPGGGVVAAPRLLNVANALTVARLLLVPVCVGFLAAGGTGYRYIAFAAFAVASMTDLADGELARRRNLITDFGKIADPIADKALTGSALITLSALGDLAWWITIVIVARELAVTALRFWVIRRGVIAASRGGKIKTLLQVIAISLYILPWAVPVERQVLMGAAVAVTLATGIDYTVRAIQLHRAVPHGLASAAPPAGGEPGGGDQGAGELGAGELGSGELGSGELGGGDPPGGGMLSAPAGVLPADLAVTPDPAAVIPDPAAVIPDPGAGIPDLAAGSPPAGRAGPDPADSAIGDSAASEADSVAPASAGDSPGGPAGSGRGGRGSS